MPVIHVVHNVSRYMDKRTRSTGDVHDKKSNILDFNFTLKLFLWFQPIDDNTVSYIDYILVHI